MSTDYLKDHRTGAQVILGYIIATIGCVLLILGMCMPPIGEIHGSVLVGVAELLIFSGCLLGIKGAYLDKVVELKRELVEYVDASIAKDK